MHRLAALSLVLCACGGGPAPAPKSVPAPVVASAAPSAAKPTAPDAASHTLPRSAVRAFVSQGLGQFLRRIEVDDQPVLVGGKFHGFRIAALKDDNFWSGVDLKPGDVVTSVNGLPIGRPEQAQTAFQSLDVSSELRVAYDRDGQPRELVYTIVDGQ
jgi:type II secretion system protein C